MKKDYEKPCFEVVTFRLQDVLGISNTPVTPGDPFTEGDDWGVGEMPIE